MKSCTASLISPRILNTHLVPNLPNDSLFKMPDTRDFEPFSSLYFDDTLSSAQQLRYDPSGITNVGDYSSSAGSSDLSDGVDGYSPPRPIFESEHSYLKLGQSHGTYDTYAIAPSYASNEIRQEVDPVLISQRSLSRPQR